jgi:hypothetical protein
MKFIFILNKKKTRRPLLFKNITRLKNENKKNFFSSRKHYQVTFFFEKLLTGRPGDKHYQVE